MRKPTIYEALATKPWGEAVSERETVEKLVGAKLVRGWILDGAGPARFGWASVHPSKQRWEGKTLADVRARYERRANDVTE